MNLSVFERLILLNILPSFKGNIQQLRWASKLRAELGFSEEERKALEFEQQGAQLRWKTEADMAVEVEIKPEQKAVVVSVLKALNKQELLGLEHMALYERFVEDKESPVSSNGRSDVEPRKTKRLVKVKG